VWYVIVLAKMYVDEIGAFDSGSGGNVSSMKYISESQAHVQKEFGWFDWGGPNF